MWKRSRPTSAVSLATATVIVGAAALGTAAAVESLRGGCRYVEEFDIPGTPARSGAPGMWRLRSEENPGVRWDHVALGDGLASLTVPATAVNDDGGFQSLHWGPVEPYGAIEVRVRGAALPGYAGFLFTYTEPGDGTFDEIDIEILADDRDDGLSVDHATSTDLRLNSWNRADAEAPPDPDASVFTTIIDDSGQAVSIHDDGLFHTFTIDWQPDRVEFHVDGILQGRLEPPEGVPDRPTDVIVGLRDLGFGGRNVDDSGRPVWTGLAALDIDYIRVCDNGVID